MIKAMEVINLGFYPIAMVRDENNRLLGTITDGDIRRALLKGYSTDIKVDQVMNENPFTALSGELLSDILNRLGERKIRCIPVVNELQEIQDLLHLDSKDFQMRVKPNRVVLMAGGVGNRLRPLTEDCPKPMLPVDGKPLLENILQSLTAYGFHHFYISVNYKAEMIKNHFGDGTKWGVHIEYLHEKQEMGTAGSLSLIPSPPDQPFLVMNSDLLTKVNFNRLLEFHQDHKAPATMCVREYDFEVPYGIVKVEGYEIKKIDEKPIQKFFVNAGIYVLNPETLQSISPQSRLDMPQLFNHLIENKIRTAAFPIHEYWMDIGSPLDFKKAKDEFQEIFK